MRGWVASSCPVSCPLLPNKLLTGAGKLLLGRGKAPHGKGIRKRKPTSLPIASVKNKTTFRKEKISVECSGQALAQRRS